MLSLLITLILEASGLAAASIQGVDKVFLVELPKPVEMIAIRAFNEACDIADIDLIENLDWTDRNPAFPITIILAKRIRPKDFG